MHAPIGRCDHVPNPTLQMVDDLTDGSASLVADARTSTQSPIKTPARTAPSEWFRICCRYLLNRLGNKRRDSEAARRFIDEQIKGYEQKLADAENRLKEFKLKNLGFTSGTGQDYFTRMNLLSEEAAKVRLELRAAEQARDAYRRELMGEDPVMLPDVGSGGISECQYVGVRRPHRCAAQAMDEMLRPLHG